MSKLILWYCICVWLHTVITVAINLCRFHDIYPLCAALLVQGNYIETVAFELEWLLSALVQHRISFPAGFSITYVGCG